MAESNRLVDFWNPPVKAVTDLRTFQYKAVRVDAAGVRPATTDVGSGPVYVLMDTPNSGQACTLNTAPNITKAVAGGTIALGDLLTITTSQTFVATSATFTAASAGNGVLWVGVARTGCDSGSLFNLALR